MLKFIKRVCRSFKSNKIRGINFTVMHEGHPIYKKMENSLVVYVKDN